MLLTLFVDRLNRVKTVGLLAFQQRFQSNKAAGRWPKKGQRPQRSNVEAIKILKRQKLPMFPIMHRSSYSSPHLLLSQTTVQIISIFIFCVHAGNHTSKLLHKCTGECIVYVDNIHPQGCKGDESMCRAKSQKPESTESATSGKIWNAGQYKASGSSGAAGASFQTLQC